MFTATDGILLPTTVTGSWPRPTWFTEALWGRPLDTGMMDPTYREQLSDALAVVVSDQERAGLDIVTNGDYFLDPDFAGRSWHHYPLQRWKGLTGDELQPATTRSPLLGYPQGTLLQEIYTTWRWPFVTGKIEANPANPLGYGKLYRMTQARTRKPVKFGTVSAQVMAFFLDSRTKEYALSDDKKQIIWDMSTAINKELREVRDSGCRVIQVEEPTIHFLSAYYPEATDTIDFLVDAWNHEVSGLDDCEIWCHTCWGNPMMQRVFDNVSYANSIATYLERMRLDVWTVEMKDRSQQDLELFGAWKGKLKDRKVAIGVVSHRTLQADQPEHVAEQARNALKYIDAENLVLSSDCGFGRAGANRTVAFFKTTAIAQGANIIRRELGGEERYVAAADELLAMDLIPEDFDEGLLCH